MSEAQEVEYERTREEKLRALVRKDVHPRVTELAERALERRQDGSS